MPCDIIVWCQPYITLLCHSARKMSGFVKLFFFSHFLTSLDIAFKVLVSTELIPEIRGFTRIHKNIMSNFIFLWDITY